MRLLQTLRNETTGRVAKVFWNTNWGEYVVRFFDEEGDHLVDADYHTNDRDDAVGTAAKFTQAQLPDKAWA